MTSNGAGLVLKSAHFTSLKFKMQLGFAISALAEEPG